jgi:hypothetical protein
MINGMKKFLSVLLFCALGLTVFFSWPSQSNSEKALGMARQSCGMEFQRNKWRFIDGKATSNLNLDELSQDKLKLLASVASENAVLANRAALLDSRWVPLAQALARLSQFMNWRLLGRVKEDSWTITIDGRIQSIYICTAIQRDANA